MRYSIIKKGSFFLVASVILILISGCETIGAMMTGDIKMQDTVQMMKSETPPLGEQENIEDIFWEKIKEIDTWMRQNLW